MIKISKKEIKEEFNKQSFNRKKLTNRELKIAFLVLIGTILLIALVESIFNLTFNNVIENIREFFAPKPQIVLMASIGQHIFGKHGMLGSLDQKAYLIKATNSSYYLIFELKNNYNIIPSTYFIFDSDQNCKRCFYHTIDVKNTGKIAVENIVVDVETFTNKINIYYQDRRMQVSENFGGYGRGGIHIKIDRLEVNESTQIAFRIDDTLELARAKCLIDGKYDCIHMPYYYKVMPWNEGGILFNNTVKYNFPENLSEGFYEINLREATFTPLPRRVISEQFGVKDFG